MSLKQLAYQTDKENSEVKNGKLIIHSYLLKPKGSEDAIELSGECPLTTLEQIKANPENYLPIVNQVERENLINNLRAAAVTGTKERKGTKAEVANVAAAIEALPPKFLRTYLEKVLASGLAEDVVIGIVGKERYAEIMK